MATGSTPRKAGRPAKKPAARAASRKAPSAKLGLADALASGDRRASLEALRDELAGALEQADVAVKAQLAGQLRGVLRDLAELPPERKSIVDELAAKRATRRATPHVGAPAPKRRRRAGS